MLLIVKTQLKIKRNENDELDEDPVKEEGIYNKRKNNVN